MASNDLRKMRRTTKNNMITFALIIFAFGIIQTILSAGMASSLLKGLLVPICIYIILAVSLNLTVGILGELSLGHAGFMCIGAYAGSLFSMLVKDVMTQSIFRFPVALFIGGLVAALFGLLIGIPVLRLKGDYLAIVTLAFGEIVKNLVSNLYIGKDKFGLHFSMKSTSDLNLDTETGVTILKGPMGITGTPKDSTFLISFIVILITLFVIMNLVDSRAGRAIMSLRDNRIAAESVGISVTKYKLIAFVVSAFFAGVAGVLYSHNLATLTATSKNFGYNMSILILVMVVLGGMGSIRGSIIAATVLTALPEVLRGMGDFRMLIYSIVLIALMLLNNNQKFKEFIGQINPKNRKKNCTTVPEAAAGGK